jgi:hypothetical protein
VFREGVVDMERFRRWYVFTRSSLVAPIDASTIDDPKVPPIESRLALVKLFLELSLYAPALLVLHGVMSSDDQEVEAWYLEGWCYFLMAEQAKENGGTLDDLSWEDLAKDSRDRLETCQMVQSYSYGLLTSS